MFEIDKQKFGAFVAELRKEKGYTQKELAERLFISDKAVSKWETAVSIPDTALLIPLADLLGVSVTELLMCARVPQDDSMDAGQVERIVKTAISYSGDDPARAYRTKSRWGFLYVLSVLLGGAGLYVNYLQGQVSGAVLTGAILGVIFGAYFCFFVKTKLPAYYDENRIGVFHDGALRMNIPGLAFNNSNWLYVVLACRIWSCLSTALLPAISVLMVCIDAEFWMANERYVFLALLLGGLFVPVYLVGKKYE